MPKQHRTPWAEPGFLDLWAQVPALRHLHPEPRAPHRPRPDSRLARNRRRIVSRITRFKRRPE